MVPSNKSEYTEAGHSCQRLYSVASWNRSRPAFAVSSLLCTMHAKRTHVPPTRYREILEHICKDLQGFILIFIVSKLAEKSENIWLSGFNLLKIKDNRQISGKPQTRHDCRLMACQLHVLGRVELSRQKVAP